jgi:hypothetical protein
MSKNMKKHCHLIFDTTVDAICKQPPKPECVHQAIKRGSFHPQHLDILYIIVAIDVIQIAHLLSATFEHRTIGDSRPEIATNHSL